MLRPGRRHALAAALVLISAAIGVRSVTLHHANGSDYPTRVATSGRHGGPVVFVGIDGASSDFIDALISRGRLPNLARVKREGAAATLRSLPCFVSPPAWASMLTGYLPERTGVYSYGRWDPEQREFATVDASDVEVPSVWEVASSWNRRVGAFNVPMSYPPSPVNGAVVGGMMTPCDMTDPVHGRPAAVRAGITVPKQAADYAPARRSATTDSLNTYLWSLHDTTDDGVRNHDTVVLDVRPAGDVYTFAVGEYSPWIRIRTRREGRIEDGFMKAGIFIDERGHTDTRLSPVFAPIDTPFTFPRSLADALRDRFGFYVPGVFLAEDLVESLARDAAEQASFFSDMDDWDLYLYVFTQSDNMHHHGGFSPGAARVYETIDRFLGEVMAKLPPGGTLVVASDHGFGEYQWGIDLNRMFEALGLLERADDGSIDHDRTLVFHNLWHLWFQDELVTREALARAGIEVPQGADPVDTLAGWLTRLCAGLHTADGIRASIGLTRLHTDGPADPDMRVDGTSGEYVVDFVYENRHDAVFHQLTGHDRFWHRRDGIVLAWGDHVTPGAAGDVYDIQDVAPTLLTLLGVPAAADMDGEVMDRLFRDLPPRFTLPDYTGLPDTPVADNRDTESLEKKLRSLGYLR